VTQPIAVAAQVALLYTSPTQIDLEIASEIGARPAALGIHYNGQVAGFAFQIAAVAGRFHGRQRQCLRGDQPQTRRARDGVPDRGGDVTPALLTAYAPSANSPL
jgi:hypothetical protein